MRIEIHASIRTRNEENGTSNINASQNKIEVKAPYNLASHLIRFATRSSRYSI